jgi:hypothetical protein
MRVIPTHGVTAVINENGESLIPLTRITQNLESTAIERFFCDSDGGRCSVSKLEAMFPLSAQAWMNQGVALATANLAASREARLS